MFQWVGGAGGVSDGGASFLSGGGCPMGEHQFWGEGGVSKKIIRWGGPCPTMGNPAQYQSPSFIHFAFQLFFSPTFFFFIPLIAFLISVIIFWSAFPCSIFSWNLLSTFHYISFSSIFSAVCISKSFP